MRQDLILIIAFILTIFGYFYIKEISLISAVLIYIHIAFPNLSNKISFYLSKGLEKIFNLLSILLLSLIYLLFLTPLGILYRKFKMNPLLLQKSNLSSTWKEVDRIFTPSDFENPY